jgi:hypothetical protein
MFIVSDNVDGSYYIDLIINSDELKRLQKSEMISGQVMIRKKRFFLGIRLKGTWDNEEFSSDKIPEGQSENQEGF